MRVTAVESTALATVGYEEDGGLLQLEFRSRAIYQYFGVPVAVHEGLLQASSKGRYFNQAIRGRFPYGPLPQWNPSAAMPLRSRR
ncbi:MAG TPA: KTSC domain-containing protein [Candidatus Solibacter sp.]|jgi:hypothetical protein